MKAITKITFREDSTSASVKVRIGTVESLITFKSSDGSTCTEVKVDDVYKNLLAAGMELSYLPLVEQYNTMLGRRDEVLKEQKIARLTIKYHQQWFLNIDLPNIPGVSFSYETLENYIKRNNFWTQDITMHYRGIDQKIGQQDVSSSRYGFSPKNIKFTIDGSLTEYKRRNYSTITAAVKKVIVLVDEQATAAIVKMDQRDKASKTLAEKMERLRSAFAGIEVTHETETVYPRYQSGRSNSYTVDRFYIVLEFGKHQLTENIDQVNSKTTYDLRGFSGLSSDQVKSIINIVK